MFFLCNYLYNCNEQIYLNRYKLTFYIKTNIYFLPKLTIQKESIQATEMHMFCLEKKGNPSNILAFVLRTFHYI